MPFTTEMTFRQVCSHETGEVTLQTHVRPQAVYDWPGFLQPGIAEAPVIGHEPHGVHVVPYPNESDETQELLGHSLGFGEKGARRKLL